MLRKLKIPARTLLCFAMMISMLAGLGLFCLAQMSEIRHTLEEMETRSIQGINLSNELGLNISRLRITAYQVHTFTTQADHAKAAETMLHSRLWWTRTWRTTAPVRTPLPSVKR